ncbi:TrkA C-terminal domain-containing protein, partial [Elusimicrobiota bacterium]
MAAVITLLLVVTLMFLITRIATIALTHTGLSKEMARFQSLSAFTGVGFTTKESEGVVNHPLRRRILLVVMVLGNAGIVTAVSSLMLTFIHSQDSGSLVLRLLFLLAGLVILGLISISRWANAALSRLVSRLLKRHTNLDVQDYASLLQLVGEYQVFELAIEGDDWLKGKTLDKAGLRDEGLLVLGIRRKDGAYRGIPDSDTGIEEGDTLIMYGRGSAVELIDERRGGKLGDIEHFDAVLEEKRIEEEERKADRDWNLAISLDRPVWV